MAPLYTASMNRNLYHLYFHVHQAVYHQAATMQAFKLAFANRLPPCSQRRLVTARAAASTEGHINLSIKKDLDKVADFVKASELPKPKARLGLSCPWPVPGIFGAPR